MKFIGSEDFAHSQEDKIGVLITNLGTPEAPTTSAVRRYLAQFLSDPRVVEVPKLIWLLILHGVILRIRPKRSAHAYKSVWTERGSPLLFHTQDQCAALAQRLRAQYGDRLVVQFGMRYGQPAIAQSLQSMADQGVRRLLVLPLYPQYSGSTSGSTFDALADDYRHRRWLPHVRFVADYYDYPAYIQALAKRIRLHWAEHGRADKLLLSYHGLPLAFLTNGDPYHCHCHVTSRLLAEELGLDSEQVLTTFQSRVGAAEWLKPYTDQTLKSLPKQGVKSIQVACPGFAADCLETIEEIGVENRAYFIENGGERYEYISALNATDEHIEMLANLVQDNLGGWDKTSATDYEARERRHQRVAENLRQTAGKK